MYIGKTRFCSSIGGIQEVEMTQPKDVGGKSRKLLRPRIKIYLTSGII